MSTGGGSISFKELNKVVREDAEKEAMEKVRKAEERKRLAYERAQYEDVLDVATLRVGTLSKLQDWATDEASMKAQSESHQVGTAEETVAEAFMDRRFGVTSTKGSPGGASGGGLSPGLSPGRGKEAERRRRLMRLRLRGTGFDDGEGEGEEPRPGDAEGGGQRRKGGRPTLVHSPSEPHPPGTLHLPDASFPSLTTLLRRLPRGPPQRLAERTATEAPRRSSQRPAITVTRHGRRPDLRPAQGDPEALPRLLDVLSLPKMRPPVPARLQSSLPTFNVSPLPPVRPDATPPLHEVAPKRSREELATMRASVSLPLLGSHVEARAAAHEARRLLAAELKAGQVHGHHKCLGR